MDDTQQQTQEFFVISTLGGKNLVTDSKELKTNLGSRTDLKIAATLPPLPVVRGTSIFE